MPERESESFSNPLAPAGSSHEEASEAHPLTNDDFRKLMMTPRVPSAKSASAPTPLHRPAASATAKTPKPDDDAFAKRKEKKIYYARLRKVEEERQKELSAKYRDRAGERRQGQNKDYAETESISTTADYRAVAPTAQLDLNNAEHRNQLIQESKYLGGDMEHTHLVKGLDYALLEKVRAEICHKEEEEEEDDMEQALEAATTGNKKEENREKEEDPEDKMEFKTKLGRNIYRTMFKNRFPDRNELFAPGRMAYCVELEEEYTESDIPTTTIRSKADIQNKEASTTLTTNDIVINKLTQILSYLRQGKRDKKKKLKERAKMRDEEKMMDDGTGIYGEVGDYMPSVKKDKERERDRRDKTDRDRRDRGDRDRDRQRSSRHERSSTGGGGGGSAGVDRKRSSYFEKPSEEGDEKEAERNLPTSAKELVDSINTRFAAQAAQASWTEKFPTAAEQNKETEEPAPTSTKPGGRAKKQALDSYAECYPGLEEAYDALGDSDDEVDYTKMDQGNKKGPVGRWDFDTQEEYSDYMANKEALPKAAFQYGVKMADGRRTRRTGPKDQKKELDREWQKIQNIISKRKQMGTQGEPSAKSAKY